MIEQVRCDLTRGLKKAETGRSGLTPQQILRSLVLMRIKNWDYRELRERIADGCTLRQFTDFYCLPVPRHDAFHRGFNRLTPETLKAIHDLVVQAAVDLGLEDGQKLRVDTTVVQTDIHHPTDNTLLWDVVRVVTRLIGRLAAALERRRIKGFRDRTRSARRRMQEIQRMTTRQRQEHQTGTYRELIGIAEEVIESARTALQQTRKARGKDMIADLAIAEMRKEIEHFCGLGARVIGQSRRRVLNGEQVPTAEKIYSIFFHTGHLAKDPALQLDGAVRRRVLGGARVSAQDYLATRKLQRDLKQAMYQAIDGIDALLTPTTETAAIRLDDVDQDKMPSRFTRFGNLLEMCALALPNGTTATGLPLSLQIVCRGYDEAMALRIGHAYQQATDWHLQAPPT